MITIIFVQINHYMLRRQLCSK